MGHAASLDGLHALHPAHRTKGLTIQGIANRISVRLDGDVDIVDDGNLGAASVSSASAALSFSAAGFIRLEWKGAETGRGRARLAPAALTASQAFSTASLLPAITV
jgi:hypothetical protein